MTSTTSTKPKATRSRRELVIVDLGHTTIMPPPWPEHRATALPVPSGTAERQWR
jgi:hypothetical protein